VIALIKCKRQNTARWPASFNEAAIVETKTNTRIGEGNVPEIWMGGGYKLGTVG